MRNFELLMLNVSQQRELQAVLVSEFIQRDILRTAFPVFTQKKY